MKMRLLARNMWSDYDTYVGRKKGYTVEIRTAFRTQHEDYGIFQYFIKSPTGEMKSAIKDNSSFKSFNECFDFIDGWIDQQLINKSN